MFLDAARLLLTEAGGLASGSALPRAGFASLPFSPSVADGLAQLALKACELSEAERESASILAALAPLRPAVLKGVALSARWPEPRMRPAGDLDLLVEPAALSTAVTTLCDRGFRVAAQASGGRLRPAPTGVELM